MGGGEGGSRGGCCGVPGDGGINVCVVGRDDGCLLSGGEGVWGGVVLAFFLIGLVSRGLGGFWRFLGLPFLGRVGLDLSSQPRVFLPQRFHLVNVVLSQVNEFVLYLGLAFKDGGQVLGDVSRRSRDRLRLLHDSSSATSKKNSR